jgi:hypothetical protein
MSNLGWIFNPSAVYFNKINFNNNFYAIPTNVQEISVVYANTHVLFSVFVANNVAASAFFSGSVGCRAIATEVDWSALKYLFDI